MRAPESYVANFRVLQYKLRKLQNRTAGQNMAVGKTRQNPRVQSEEAVSGFA
jgi:hypothetical protein